MTGREAFRQLKEEFYTKIQPYTNHKDEEGLHDFCVENIERLEKQFAKTLTLNGLPEATYSYGIDRGVPSEGVLVTDFGNGFFFFFEISMKSCFNSILDREMPEVNAHEFE